MTVAMKPIVAADRQVANIKTAKYQTFVIDGVEVPGHSFLQFDDTFPEGVGFTIYRMAPGARSIPHEHTCHEQFFIIEGELIDNDGYVYKPGDFVLLKEGTQHNSYTETGCTLALFIRQLERNL
jgi:mannose-6-phosphate isomerase-like protein (cupin superfamily)